MKYRFEYCGNPEYVELHITERLIDHESGFIGVFAGDALTENDRQVLSLLKGCAGAVEVTLRTYSVTAKRGFAFDREEVLGAMLESLKAWLSLKGISEDWEQLPTLRSDIRMGYQCPSCKAEQDAEMARCARDFDKLDLD